MSDASAFGFGKFVPGFDFLQNLAKSAGQSQTSGSAIPGMSNWVAPTLSVEELDKRIQELKAVQFWLEQNGTALDATIQALEVQKMTLATLKGMNLSLQDVAESFKIKPEQVQAKEPPKPSFSWGSEPPKAAPEASAAQPERQEAAKPAVDPMQWWGALTQQFTELATQTVQATSSAAAEAQARAAGAMQDVMSSVAAAAVTPPAAPEPAPAAAKKAAARRSPAADPGSAPAPARKAARKTAAASRKT